ncbi:MAG: starch-binding protein [Muribaculaceae bacterium]|nr:starch-binding protein [Muribaculaceae bacterium]
MKINLIAALAMLAPFAATAQDAEAERLIEQRAYYSTNAGDAVGKAASITIDGDFSDWTDDMIVATCGANDIATAFKGSHENCVLDLYAVYAAWDDSKLYIAWQMCNTGDTWARPGDGPLTDYGRIGDVPLIVALSLDPSRTGMNGRLEDGRFIWGENPANGVTFTSHVDHLFFMSGKAGQGEPAMFTAVNDKGDTNYGAGCRTFAKLGISYKMAEGFAPSHLWRQRTTAEWATPTELISDPEVLNNIYDPECYDNLKAGLPEGLKQHDYKYDSFYEMSIPLSALGIDREWLESNGIGVRVVATRGESAIDCCPFDPSMVDNTFGEYGKDNSTTHEKDDIDDITYELASVGKMRTGTVTPLPNPEPDPEPNPGPDPLPVDGNYKVYFDNSASAWGAVYTWIWDAAEGNKNYTGGTWPGTAMQLDSATGYYVYAFDCDASAPNLMCIFNNGSDQGKTKDLTLVNNGIYTAAGYSGTNVSGVEAIATSEAYSVEGLTIRCESNAALYSIQGVCVAQGCELVAPAAGVYILRIGECAYRMMLR